jgi:farnesyl diphosphate synthase
MTFEQWMRSVLDRVETALDHYLPAQTTEPATLHEAMRYAVLGGGKRVRPLLVHAAGELTNARAECLDAAAVALEMIHVYSLVHDDMPCMTTTRCVAASPPYTSSMTNRRRCSLATRCNRRLSLR